MNLQITFSNTIFEQKLDVLMMAAHEERQPFLSSNIDDMAAEDLLDLFEDEEVEEILSLLCRARLGLLQKLVAPLVILFYVFLSFMYILPSLEMDDAALFTLKSFVFALIALTLISYFKASCSSPGSIPKEWLCWNGDWSAMPQCPVYCRLNAAVSLDDEDKLKRSASCKWCGKHRPFRSGHCSECSECVSLMDHHCQILRNCVGAYNHRFFVQFIVYLAVILSLYLYFGGVAWSNHNELVHVSWCLALVLWWWLMLRMVIPQIHQMLLNELFIERKFQTLKTGNFYETGSVLKNVQIVMGSSVLRWFLPLEWTPNDLKLRLIPQHRASFDLLNANVQLRNAVDAYTRNKSHPHKTKYHL